MDYMFLIYVDEEKLARATPEENEEKRRRNWAILDDAMSRGIFRGASPLESVGTAVTVRASEGRAVRTDGPFAETKEVLGGYWILDCAGRDEAVTWAERIAQTGCAESVEVRPIAAVPNRAPQTGKDATAALVNV